MSTNLLGPKIGIPLLQTIESISCWSPVGHFPTGFGAPFIVDNGDNASLASLGEVVPQQSWFRVVNLAVDMVGSTAADRTIEYLDYWGQPQTYCANFSGYHDFKGQLLLSAGSAIDPEALQIGI